MLGFHGEDPAGHPRDKFLYSLEKNPKTSAVKHSLEKPILLNFVSLCATFYSNNLGQTVCKLIQFLAQSFFTTIKVN